MELSLILYFFFGQVFSLTLLYFIFRSFSSLSLSTFILYHLLIKNWCFTAGKICLRGIQETSSWDIIEMSPWKDETGQTFGNICSVL